jgi:hypothetical protein
LEDYRVCNIKGFKLRPISVFLFKKDIANIHRGHSFSDSVHDLCTLNTLNASVSSQNNDFKYLQALRSSQLVDLIHMGRYFTNIL